MGKPPQVPYPPDAPAEPVREMELADATDLVVVGADWANQRARGLRLTRVELRGCRLTGAELAESELVDVVFAGCRLDLAGLRFAKLERATVSELHVERVELRSCGLAGLVGAEALRGARMPWDDVAANAVLFATALGIEVLA